MSSSRLSKGCYIFTADACVGCRRLWLHFYIHYSGETLFCFCILYKPPIKCFSYKPFNYKAHLWGTHVILTYINFIILTARASVLFYTGVTFQVTSWSLLMSRYYLLSDLQRCSRAQSFLRSLMFSLCSATKGVQVHSDLLPRAHHANRGVHASYR